MTAAEIYQTWTHIRHPIAHPWAMGCLLWLFWRKWLCRIEVRHHYNDVIMGAMASQITSLTIVLSTVYSDADQRKHQSSASLAFVRGIHRGPVNSPHKGPVTRKMFPFDDVMMMYFRRSCVSTSSCTSPWPTVTTCTQSGLLGWVGSSSHPGWAASLSMPSMLCIWKLVASK